MKDPQKQVKLLRPAAVKPGQAADLLLRHLGDLLSQLLLQDYHGQRIEEQLTRIRPLFSFPFFCLNFWTTRANWQGWAFWEGAVDEDGKEFKAQPSPVHEVQDGGRTYESIIIPLTRAYLEEHAAKPFQIRIEGKRDRHVAIINPSQITGFLLSVDQTLSNPAAPGDAGATHLPQASHRPPGHRLKHFSPLQEAFRGGDWEKFNNQAVDDLTK